MLHELCARLNDLAFERGISLDMAILPPMQRGAHPETTSRTVNVVGDALDEFVGSQSREDVVDLFRLMQTLENIDPESWK